MSVGEVADARGIHPCDAFLDLVVKHGSAFRWKTLIANHRPEVLDSLISSPHVQIGFADSGAHLRNMAFYNFPLCFLKRVRDAKERGEPLMTLDRAVHRVTAELADWFDLDAGRIEVGSRADIAIIRPQALDEELYAYHEAEMAEMGHVSRMVRRNDRAVLATLVGGEVVFESGNLNPELGDRAFGRFLRAGETNRNPLSARTKDGLRRSA